MKEKETEESGELGTETEPIEETPKQKRIPDLDEADTLTKTIVAFPRTMLKELQHTAIDKNVSQGAILREALKRHLAELKKPIEENPEAIISDEELNEILEACTTYYGGFEVDGEKGFIETMKANEFLLSDLTPEQWIKVQEKISIGFSGYTFKPSLEEFASKFDVLEPTEEQKEWLSTDTSEQEAETTIPEKT